MKPEHKLPVDQYVGALSMSRRSVMKLMGTGLLLATSATLLAACGEDDAADPDDPDFEPEDTDDEVVDTDDEPVEDDSDDDDMAEPSGGQAIIAGFLKEPDSLLPGHSTTATSSYIYHFVANGLIRLSLPEMEVTPDLAESWDVSDDGAVIDFHLRDNVLWHDGEAFSARDVKASYETWAHPDWPSGTPGNLLQVEGAADYRDGAAEEISGIEIVDDYQVTFTLIEGSPLFMSTTTSIKLLPAHRLEGIPPEELEHHEIARSPVFTGPYEVEEWRAGEGLIYRANPDFFGDPPNIERLVARNIPDPATALAELRSGEVQLYDEVPADQFQEFVDNPDYETKVMSGISGWFFRFDLTNPMFEDRAVRQAMSHAIDRQSIIDALFQGRAEINASMVSPVSWLYNPDIARFDEYDPDLSVELLEEAGWELNGNGIRERDGVVLSFGMMVYHVTEQWALAVQPFLDAVGIHYELDVVEFGTWISRMNSRDYEATVGGWFNFTLDPRMDLASHFQTPRPIPDGTGYNNEEVNERFEQAAGELDPDEELRLYHEIQELVAEDIPHVYLWRPNNLLAYRHNEIEIPDIETIGELYAALPQWRLLT